MFRAALRQGDWKLSLRATLPAKVELYNIAKDPGETTNLAAENAPLVAALQKRIDDLSREMKPSLFFQETFKSYLGRHAPAPVFPNDDASSPKATDAAAPARSESFANFELWRHAVSA